MARLKTENPNPFPAAVDIAWEYLNGKTSLKDKYVTDASMAYARLQLEGKLASRDTKGLAHAISHWALFSTANHMNYNHPDPQARQELVAPMSTLNHPKGASWICQHGQDRNPLWHGS